MILNELADIVVLLNIEGCFSTNICCCNIVNEELSLTAVFRSNDMFSAWPANAMGLRLYSSIFVMR
jgi:hypothetical protein